jgi:hypothetical protein
MDHIDSWKKPMHMSQQFTNFLEIYGLLRQKTLMGLNGLTNSWKKSMHASKLFTIYLEIFVLLLQIPLNCLNGLTNSHTQESIFHYIPRDLWIVMEKNTNGLGWSCQQLKQKHAYK